MEVLILVVCWRLGQGPSFGCGGVSGAAAAGESRGGSSEVVIAREVEAGAL